MRSEGDKRFKYRSLLICFLCDRLFWIPVTVAVVFDDYTILHSTDHPDCAMDLFSLQHLAASWLSEFLTELRNDRCIFTLHSDCAVCLMVACGDIPAQDFHQRFCSRISFGILTLDSGSLRRVWWYFSAANRSSGIFAVDCLCICVVFVKMWFFCALLALVACEC